MSIISKSGEFIRQVKSFSIINYSENHPKQYFYLTLLFSLIGFVYLMLFPVGFITGFQNALLLVSNEISNRQLIDLVFWSCVTLICGFICYRIATIRFELPKGFELNTNNAARLIKIVEDIESTYKWPKIDKILLSPSFELKITKIPVFGIPLWSKTVLIVGFQLLQTTTPDNLESLLTHKLHQYSRRNNLILNWLNSLRDCWEQLALAVTRRGKMGDELLYCFFNPYSRIYKKLSLVTAQSDCLKGDDLALNKLNDRDYFRAIEEYYLLKNFLNTHFWPKIFQLIKEKGTQPGRIKPYNILPHAIEQAFTANNTSLWLRKLCRQNENFIDEDAPFARRMYNIGYSKPIPINRQNSSSAMFIFNKNYNNVAAFVDKLWVNRILKSMRARRQKALPQSQGKVEAKLRAA